MPSDKKDPDINLDTFVCIQCHACCRQTGYVRLHTKEPDEIAAYLGMEVLAFIETYTLLTRDRQCLSLKDQEDGSCIFLGNSGCRIHPVKPRQCKSFPREWKFSNFKEICGWARQQIKKSPKAKQGPATAPESPTLLPAQSKA